MKGNVIMDEITIMKVRYVTAECIKGDVNIPGWFTQVDDIFSVFDTRRLKDAGFLTSDCECELVLRKKR